MPSNFVTLNDLNARLRSWTQQPTLARAGVTIDTITDLIARLDPFINEALRNRSSQLCSNLMTLAERVGREFNNQDITLELIRVAKRAFVQTEKQRPTEAAAPATEGSLPSNKTWNKLNCHTADRAVDIIVEKKWRKAELQYFPDLTDAHLERLAKQRPDITDLKINSQNVTQASAAHIVCFTQLQYLHIHASKLTSLHLQNSPDLMIFSYEGSNLNEVHFSNSCPKLSMIYIGDSSIDTLRLPLHAPQLEILHLVKNQKLKTIEWPSKDGRTPCLDKLNKFDVFDSPIEDLSALSHAKKLTDVSITQCNRVIALDLHHATSINRVLVWNTSLKEMQLPQHAADLLQVCCWNSPELTPQTITHYELHKDKILIGPLLEYLANNRCFPYPEAHCPSGLFAKPI